MKGYPRRTLCILLTVLLLLAGSVHFPATANTAGAAPALDGQMTQGEFLVKFKPGTSALTKRSLNLRYRVTEKGAIPRIDVHILAVPRDKSVAEMVAVYRKNPNVVFAEPNYIAQAEMVPSDPYFSNWQKGLQRMGAPAAWDLTTGSAEIVIAVLDTGVRASHEDLAGRLTAGYNFVSGNDNTADDHGHGTRVTGIIAAATDNGRGVAGTTWQNLVMPVKVMGSNGSGTYSDLAKGIIYAADNGARVINMSLGGSNPSSALKSAVDYAHSRNVVLVAAAGNSNGPVAYPAAYPNVIAVAAVDNSDNKASYSCYGPEISVAAPGSGVFSTVISGGYDVGSGTSFAAPFVSGLAGLVLSLDPALTPAQVQDIIERGADDVGEAGFDPYTGWGRINMAASLSLLAGAKAGAEQAAEAAPEPEPEPAPGPEPSPAPAAPEPAPEPQEPQPAAPQTIVFSGSVGDRKQGGTAAHTINVSSSGTLSATLTWNTRRTDLDLYLLDPAGRVAAVASSSSQTGLREEISVPVSVPGVYTLQVVAVSGKSSYTLTVTLP